MKPRAFTLIELLVVIAIIAILMAITLPAMATANDRSNMARCQTNLRQIFLACKMYAEDYGAFPPSLEALYQARYIDDPETLVCSKTGQRFDYHPARENSSRETWLATCVPVKTPMGSRPHTHGEVLVGLRVGGQVTLVR